jgi:hypothetical protein
MPTLLGMMRKQYKTPFKVIKRVILPLRGSQQRFVGEIPFKIVYCYLMADDLFGLVKSWEDHQSSNAEPGHHIPSLFPLYLPFKTQHRLLVS